MQFSSARIKRERNLRKDLSISHRLLMYKEPPIDNISLEDFEEFAVERLKVLRDVETFGIRYKKDTDDYKKKLEDSLRHFLPTAYITVIPDGDKKKYGQHLEDKRKDIKKDIISHFILRLAYCRSEDLRRWFLAQEMELFRFRFVFENDADKAEKSDNKKGDQVDRFLKENNLQYTPIEKDEELTKNLAASGYKTTSQDVQYMDYFKVRFENVLDLVRTRKVFLKEGYAYVPRSELASIIVNVYRTHLSHALAMTARALPYLEEDERLLPRLTNLSKQYVGQDYTQKKTSAAGKVTLDQIDSLSQNAYPLCMRQLHQALRENHHLRHGGRMQYGLFLKGIGITLEEALIFWRSEFMKMMDVDKFDKQYAYNIRHNYGKEGKRADYTPYSCMKIIMSNQPAAGDYHGCPFRHTDRDLLRQKLQAYKVPQEGVTQILSLVQESHYQLACTRYFELTHGVSVSSPFAHPNQYFDESRRVTQEQGQTSVFAVKETLNKTGMDKARQTVKKEQPQETENGDFDIDMECDELTEEEMAEIVAM